MANSRPRGSRELRAQQKMRPCGCASVSLLCAHPLHPSCPLLPLPRLPAQVQGCQQVPEAWGWAENERPMQGLRASLEARPNLLAPVSCPPPSCCLPQSRAPELSGPPLPMLHPSMAIWSENLPMASERGVWGQSRGLRKCSQESESRTDLRQAQGPTPTPSAEQPKALLQARDLVSMRSLFPMSSFPTPLNSRA